MREGNLLVVELLCFREGEVSFCAGFGWRSAPTYVGRGREGRTDRRGKIRVVYLYQLLPGWNGVQKKRCCFSKLGACVCVCV